MLIIFLVLPVAESCGQAVVDSLTKRLAQTTSDSLRADILISLSMQVSNDSLARHYANESIALSERIGDHLRMAKGYYRLASIQDVHGDIAAARASLDAVNAQLSYVSDPRLEARTVNYYGILDYFEGNYNKAATSLWKAIRLYQAIGDSLAIASCYVNIGTCYKSLRNNQKALGHFGKALDIYRSLNNEIGVAVALGNIGNIYQANGKYDSALYCFKQSLEVNLKNNLIEDAAIDLNNIGNLFLKQGESSKALPYFRRSYAMSESIGARQRMLTAGYNIGVIEMMNHRPRVAIYTFLSQLRTAKRHNYKEHVMDLYEILSTAHENLHEYSAALSYRKTYEIWKDSLINEHHLNEVREQEIRYETEKKDNQIQLLAKEKQLQQAENERASTVKNTFVAGFILVLVAGAVAIYAIRQRLLVVTKDKALQEATLRQQMTELEMKALRAQINPHFLFNCLNSINRMIVKGENESASMYLRKFSKLVRLILENTESNNISLENELSLIESYIQLEELRFKGRIHYEIATDGINKQNTYLPPMILQPFIENAIWHGLSHKDDQQQASIKIFIEKKEDILLCSITDNGIGRDRSMSLRAVSDAKSKSMGIRVTEERLQLLNGEKHKEVVKITDLKNSSGEANGTQVNITIQLI